MSNCNIIGFTIVQRIIMDYIEQTMKRAVESGCCKGDTNFFQALKEVLISIKPLLDKYPRISRS